MIRFQPVTQGAVVAVREIGDFGLTETTHPPSLSLPRHAHARPAATLVLVTARDFLHVHFAEPIRIRDAARAAGVHPVHLARVFRREYGRSPSAYLRDLRLAWAHRALTHGSRSLAWIALEAGFADQSHLSRTFKRAYGVSPRRFREALREKSRSR